jgi:RNA polymerase sporulation-specific sigma factor
VLKLPNEKLETSALILKYMNLVKIKAYKSKKLCRRFDIDVDDLISEGFLGLLSAIRSFDETKGSFEAYANVCISNKIKSTVFSGSQLLIDNEFDVTQTADKQLLTDEIVIEKESEHEISSTISEILSELELKVFTLYLDSHSYSSIASRLSIPIKTVDNALSRARSKLRKIYFKGIKN